MDDQTQKPPTPRERLRTYFENGKIPSQDHYGEMINSMLHKTEDGFSQDPENGLKIYGDQKNNQLISFYKDVSAKYPFFSFAKDRSDPDSIKMQPVDSSKKNNGTDDDSTGVFFHLDGKLGIGKKCDDKYKVDINGFVAMPGRIGTYEVGEVDADGEWKTITKKEALNNGQAFEVVARTGKIRTGKYAIMHAIALSVFGPRGARIRITNAYYGLFWNRLRLRWRSDELSKTYHLEIKSCSNYGKGVKIFYTMTRLWDDKLFMSEDYYNK